MLGRENELTRTVHPSCWMSISQADICSRPSADYYDSATNRVCEAPAAIDRVERPPSHVYPGVRTLAH